jgi:hypothetical protein
MIRGKIILSVLFAVFVMQAGFSIGKICFVFFYQIFSINIFYDKGFPLNRGDLQMLLMKALKIGDCARIVPVTDPIPLRFRRSTNRKKFQCIITLN